MPLGTTARRALVRYLGTRARATTGDPLFTGRQGALSQRGTQQAIARLGRRAGAATRCSPHTFRHPRRSSGTLYPCRYLDLPHGSSGPELLELA